jgi:hypothetical protein
MIKNFEDKNSVLVMRAFAQLGMVGKAAEAAGIDRDYHYYWLKSDESYRRAFEQARQIAGDRAFACS